MMRFLSVFLATLSILFSGCATLNVANEAKGETVMKDGKVDHIEQGHPELYLLVPIALPIDIATFPIQAIWFFTCFHG